jgi:hypothetical protein
MLSLSKHPRAKAWPEGGSQARVEWPLGRERGRIEAIFSFDSRLDDQRDHGRLPPPWAGATTMHGCHFDRSAPVARAVEKSLAPDAATFERWRHPRRRLLDSAAAPAALTPQGRTVWPPGAQPGVD